MGIEQRIRELRRKLQMEELDAMLISNSDNRRYLSGFTGSSGYLVVTQKELILLTDFRYTEQAINQSPEFRIERVGGSYAWLSNIVEELGINKMGFESQDLTFATHALFKDNLNESAINERPPSFIPTNGIVENIRILKDGHELELLTYAIGLSDNAINKIAPCIEAGTKESEIAWSLEKDMRDGGAESLAFDIIVGSGSNGALPHHRAGEKVIQDGDAVVIDMGARYEGYNSDLTRTVIVGKPNETFSEVYEIVLNAQMSAIENVREGMTGGEVDAISRNIITEAGYGDAFGHSLGHGVGLAVHENPRISPNSIDVLQNGMVFTIEPGIYINGWGGVRIEDVVVLENGRARVISNAEK